LPAERLPPASLGVSLVAVSWAAVLIVLTRSSPSVVAFGRLAFAALLLSPALLWPRVRRELWHARRRLGWALLAGALLGLHLLFWIASLRLTSVASSLFLLSTQAVMALLVSHTILREPVRRLGWAAVGLVTLGALVIGGGDLRLEGALGGDLLAVLAAAAFVAYLAVGRKARHGLSIFPWLLVVYGSASLVLVPYMAITGATLATPRARELLLFLALAAGPTILGHGLMNYAVRYLRIHVVQLVSLSEPFLALVWAWLILHTTVPAWAWPGGILVATGCAIAIWEERRHQKQKAPPLRAGP
jgi:drug/metabolite transporter (DMT)-like permease